MIRTHTHPLIRPKVRERGGESFQIASGTSEMPLCQWKLQLTTSLWWFMKKTKNSMKKKGCRQSGQTKKSSPHIISGWFPRDDQLIILAKHPCQDKGSSCLSLSTVALTSQRAPKSLILVSLAMTLLVFQSSETKRHHFDQLDWGYAQSISTSFKVTKDKCLKCCQSDAYPLWLTWCVKASGPQYISRCPWWM